MTTKKIEQMEDYAVGLSGGSIPIDLGKIAGALKAVIYEEELEDNVSGMLITSKSKDNSIIVINKNHHENRKRFTIAHELSHLLLHRDVKDTFIDSVGTATLYFRSEKSSEVLKEVEKEANHLASSILMPKKVMLDLLNNNPIDINDDASVKVLAKRLGVSIQALSIRLSVLRLTS